MYGRIHEISRKILLGIHKTSHHGGVSTGNWPERGVLDAVPTKHGPKRHRHITVMTFIDTLELLCQLGSYQQSSISLISPPLVPFWFGQ
jgi:hypothetical protein